MRFDGLARTTGNLTANMWAHLMCRLAASEATTAHFNQIQDEFSCGVHNAIFHDSQTALALFPTNRHDSCPALYIAGPALD